jgi:exodeoxyribonuclease V alpha subunit
MLSLQQTTSPPQQQTILSTFDIFTLSEFTGIIDFVRFHNAQNSYSILKVLIPGQKDEFGEKLYIAAVGSMASPRPDAECIFRGKWVDDKKWGKQFKFSSYEVLLPSDDQGIVSYLADICFGVGKAKAKKIVEEFKAKYPERNILEVIQENPAVLKESKVINPAQAEEIIKNLMENSVLAELSSLICGEGISPGLAARIYAEYGPGAVEKVKDNPYLLSDEVYGVGFKRADAIAMRIGVPKDSEYRIKAAITYILKEAQSNGHCYLEPKHILRGLREGKQLVVTGLKDLLGFEPEIKIVAAANEKLIDEQRCVRQGDAVYDYKLHEAEVGVAAHMLRLAGQKVEEIGDVDTLINEIAQKQGFEYAPEQHQGIKISLTNGLSILTGGPGVGKSFTTNGIVSIYRKTYPYRPIYLCAPTGRAAKRLTEATGLEAKTIHRLLRYNPFEGGFEYCLDNQLSGPGLLLIDEVSMMGIELANDLFQAIPDNIQVIMVGDPDQLPSVSAGNVLRDSINSGVIPTVHLKYNYRQAAGSRIAEYAHLICQGEWKPPIGDDLILERISEEIPPAESSQIAAQTIVNLVVKATQEGYGILEWQALSPQRKGTAGVNNLNELLRDAINPKGRNKPEIAYGKSSYRLGDKILVVKNDYGLGVFNGDLGVVSVIVGSDYKEDEKRGPGLFANFDGEEVFFDMDHLGLLDLAYCTTTHKGQGSEFKLCIVACLRSHWIMLQRSNIYTAVTRARKKLVVVAQDSALKQAVDNNKIEDRFSLLSQRLKGEI